MKRVYPLVTLALSLLVNVTLSGTEPIHANSIGSETIQFAPLQIGEQVTSFAVTEDRAFIAFTHQEANKVSIWDVGKEQVVQAFDTTSPRSVISRGNKFYVANYGEGTISVFSFSTKWEFSDQLEAGHPRVLHLSAPFGKHFKNLILVTCHDKRGERSGPEPGIYALNTRTDRHQRVSGAPLGSFSYDGKVVFTQESFNQSPSGGVAVYNAKDFISGRGQVLFRGGITQTPYLYQVHEGNTWLGPRALYGGARIQQVANGLGRITIPDLTNKLIYALFEQELKAHSFGGQFQETGTRSVSFPPAQTKAFRRIYHHLSRRRGYLLDQPIAFQYKGQIQFFLLDLEDRTILHAKTDPFPNPLGSIASKPNGPTPPTKEKGLPSRIGEGMLFEYEFGEGSFELMTGPEGMNLSEGGKLSWVPNKEQVGTHRLKIKARINGKLAFLRPTIEVVDKALMESAGGDITKIDSFKSLKLEVDHMNLKRSLDARNLLLLQGESLKVLASDGITIEKQIQLPNRYDFIGRRKSHYVAVSTRDKKIDILDSASERVTRTIKLDAVGIRILKITDFALNPKKNECYLAISHDIHLPRYRILIINEDTGRVAGPEHLLGTWMLVHPSGDFLYSGYRDIYERGMRFHINPNLRIITTPKYGNVDWLLTYDLRARSPRLIDGNFDAGGNGKGIRMSLDGKRITYLSHVGYPTFSKNLVAFDPKDLRTTAVTYPLKGKGQTTELAYHPTRPLVAVPGGTSALLLHRETGQIQENLLRISSTGVGNSVVEKLIFSPDGKNLIFVCNSPSDGRYLRAVPLNLTPSELASSPPPSSPSLSSSTNPPPAKAQPRLNVKPVKVPTSNLHALNRNTLRVSSRVEIADKFTNSIVLVESDEGTASGFVVGSNGYIVTSAHAVSPTGRMRVTYNTTIRNQSKSRKMTAKVLRVDETNDLALLKVLTAAPLPTITLSNSADVPSGEEITVIGNPSLGDKVLSNTVTAGIISNSKRVIDGRKLIQFTADINPGSSGGPVFDSKGYVVGIVLGKADLDGAGFAVSSRIIREFLERAAE